MFSSLVTGLLIGAEREFRDKSAGLRTHTLVCFASTLLMLAATRQDEWLTDFIPGPTSSSILPAWRTACWPASAFSAPG